MKFVMEDFALIGLTLLFCVTTAAINQFDAFNDVIRVLITKFD
jgi:hypothetical protein